MGTATWSFDGVEGTATTIVYPGEEITLTATPKSGYMFTGWSDGTSTISNSKTCTVTVEEGKTYTANFALAGADYEVSPTSGTFDSDAKSSVWTYTITDSNPVPLQLKTTSGDVDVLAMSVASNKHKYYAYAYDSNNAGHTPITYTLSVPEGFVITGYDMTYFLTTTTYNEVTVSNGVDDPITLSDKTDQRLWRTGLNDSSVSFTLTASKAGQQAIAVRSFTVSVLSTGGGSVTPPATTQYTVTVSTNGTGGTATVNGEQTATVDAGSTVTIVATPAQGYRFVRWKVDGEDSAEIAEWTIQVTEDYDFQAIFEPIQYTVKALTNGTGGTATVAVGTGAASSSVEVEAGTTVTFYAQAVQGYEFVNWTKDGNVVSTDPQFIDVPVTADLELTANFRATSEPSTPTSYPTMTVSGYNNTNANRYLAKVTASTATQYVTVFEVTSDSEFTNPTTTALIDKTATPIIVKKGETELNMTFVSWLNNVSGNASQMDWVQQAVYIDWNNDGNFTDSEIYAKSSDGLGGIFEGGAADPVSASFEEPTGYTRTIAIPANQAVGTYRMRVVYHEPAARGTNNWHETLFTENNGAISKGRAYDFALQIVEGASTPDEP